MRMAQSEATRYIKSLDDHITLSKEGECYLNDILTRLDEGERNEDHQT